MYISSKRKWQSTVFLSALVSTPFCVYRYLRLSWQRKNKGITETAQGPIKHKKNVSFFFLLFIYSKIFVSHLFFFFHSPSCVHLWLRWLSCRTIHYAIYESTQIRYNSLLFSLCWREKEKKRDNNKTKRRVYFIFLTKPAINDHLQTSNDHFESPLRKKREHCRSL